MKAKNYSIGIMIGAALATAVYFIVGYKTIEKTEVDQETTHEEEHDHGHGSNMRTVDLNTAQYKNADIELGWFEMKNLSEVVNANGYTKLPPQNQADVSVFAGGLVKSIQVIEGQAVKKGDLLATIESPEFTILQQHYLMSKSNLEYLKLEYERQQNLSMADVNTKKILQKTKAELDTEQAQFNSLEKQMQLFGIKTDGPPTSTIGVRSPITGHITDVKINIGTAVEVGKPLFSIVDNSEIHLDLLVYEKDLPKVKEGQNVRFVLTNQSNKEINGTIFNIGKSFENESKTVAVHAHIHDKGADLIPGMYVNALIDIDVNSVRTLPEKAVVQAEGRDFIFIYKPEAEGNHGHSHGNNKHEFTRVEVKKGASQLGYVEVTPVQKITEGYKIVVNGAYYLQSHLQKSESGGEHAH